MPIVFAKPATIIDPDTVLLIHSDTTNGSTTFVDSSGLSTTASFNPVNGMSHSTDFAKFGATSLKFADTNLLVANTDPSLPFRWGTGDFTHDFWVYRPTTWGGWNFVAGQENDNIAGACSAVDSTTTMRFGYRRSVSADVWFKSGVAVPAATWTHIAFVRASGVGYVFVDGVLDGSSFAMTTDFAVQGDNIGFGSSLANSNNPRLTGSYMDEIRISKVARWTSNFTPPTAPYAS